MMKKQKKDEENVISDNDDVDIEIRTMMIMIMPKHTTTTMMIMMMMMITIIKVCQWLPSPTSIHRLVVYDP